MENNTSLRMMFGQQPAPVWVMAFIAMVGFMGIGLVDPILTSIAHGLNATPRQVSLLFTSYFMITSLMMLVVGVLFSRMGGKRTLLLGLFLIAVFAGLSGLSASIEQLVWFRAGWGLGNAFFVVTALSMIVASAVGSKEVPVLLYEAFLGLGISMGPLVGAVLGHMSWRYPFFGTAFLMVIGFFACLFFLKKPEEKSPEEESTDTRDQPITFATTFQTFTHKGLVLNAVSAFFYNYGMFTLLAFVPFVLDLSPYATGAIFFGWGIMLAIFSVMVAPRLKARFGNVRIISASLMALALLFLVICTGHKAWIIAAVVIAGAFMGLNNTAYTEIALEISPFPRASASAAYNCIRWFGGVVAPFTSAYLAEHLGHAAPFAAAALCACVAIGLIYINREAISELEERHEETIARVVATIAPARAGVAPSPLPNPEMPILVAIDNTSATDNILAYVRQLFAGSTAPIHVLHVRLIESVEGIYGEIESDRRARELVRSAVAALQQDGNKTITGNIIDSPVSRIPASIYNTAAQIHAQLIVIGARHKNNLSTLLRGSVSENVLRNAQCPVLVLPEVDQAAGGTAEAA